jgi:hypothetical protein
MDNAHSMPQENNRLMFEGQLCIVMSSRTRSGFDFVGVFSGKDSQYVYLDNPLVLDYGDNLTLRGLAPLHLPAGTVDILGMRNRVALPHDGVGYISVLPEDGDDWIHEAYREFFSASPHLEEFVKTSQLPSGDYALEATDPDAASREPARQA